MGETVFLELWVSGKSWFLSSVSFFVVCWRNILFGIKSGFVFYFLWRPKYFFFASGFSNLVWLSCFEIDFLPLAAWGLCLFDFLLKKFLWLSTINWCLAWSFKVAWGWILLKSKFLRKKKKFFGHQATQIRRYRYISMFQVKLRSIFIRIAILCTQYNSNYFTHKSDMDILDGLYAQNSSAALLFC